MSQDITKYVEQVVKKLTGNNSLIDQFKKNPVKIVTDILGIKLDNQLIQAVIKAVQGKLNIEDLRSLIFSLQQDHPADGNDEVDESRFPYEVQRETLVFGGHETWLKAIKPMLTGNVRFIDKDLIFDTGIIRHSSTAFHRSSPFLREEKSCRKSLPQSNEMMRFLLIG